MLLTIYMFIISGNFIFGEFMIIDFHTHLWPEDCLTDVINYFKSEEYGISKVTLTPGRLIKIMVETRYRLVLS